MSNDIVARLAEPFQPKEVQWKPAVVSGNRALALAYIDARTVMDRLDEVMGPLCWKDKYALNEDGTVVCSLSLKVEAEWITKEDVGGATDPKDPTDRAKSAFSDALKRAAVKFGIGRYLYRFPSQWVDYDPKQKQFSVKPQLPAFAIPGKKTDKPVYQNQSQSTETITTEQASKLALRVKKLGREAGKFLEYWGFKSFTDIPAAKMPEIETAMRRWETAEAKKQQGAA